MKYIIVSLLCAIMLIGIVYAGESTGIFNTKEEAQSELNNRLSTIESGFSIKEKGTEFDFDIKQISDKKCDITRDGFYLNCKTCYNYNWDTRTQESCVWFNEYTKSEEDLLEFEGILQELYKEKSLTENPIEHKPNDKPEESPKEGGEVTIQ